VDGASPADCERYKPRSLRVRVYAGERAMHERASREGAMHERAMCERLRALCAITRLQRVRVRSLRAYVYVKEGILSFCRFIDAWNDKATKRHRSTRVHA